MAISETALFWILGIIASSIAALYLLLLAHLKSSQATQEKLVEIDVRLGSLKEDLAAVQREVGSHETGIRGSLHRLREETRTALHNLERNLNQKPNRGDS